MKFAASFVTLFSLFSLVLSAGDTISPWGVCAHFNRAKAEFNYRTDEQLKLMKEAGIKSARMDIGFGLICPRRGEYHFEHMDKVYEKLHENGITLLPILSGYAWELQNVRPDVVPMHDHPEEWRNFIRALAEHFKGKIKVWSFWNEPHGGFWHPKPDPEQYVKLLKITCEELKKTDPANQIMLGGISAHFLTDVCKLGGDKYFDLVSIHPYGWGGDRNPGFDRALDEMRETLRRYGCADKPVWFTECGSSCARNEFLEQQPEAIADALRIASEKIGRPIDFTKPVKIGVPYLTDVTTGRVEGGRPWLPDAEFVPVSLKQLNDLDPAEIPAVVPSETESIDEEFVEPLRKYIRRGGIVLAFGQIPFYTLRYTNKFGSRAMRSAADELYPAFRMGWHAFWTRPGTPESTLNVKPAPGMEKEGFKASPGHVNRYLNGDTSDKKMHYTPLLQSVANGKVVGDALSIYTYDDWKGAIIGSTLIKFTDFVTPQQQADLAQTFSCHALSRGVPRFYFYVFRDTGIRVGEREDNFGMVTRDLRQKPFYKAFKAMTEALGSRPVFVENLPAPEGFRMMRFKRAEDGKTVCAFWSINPKKAYSVEGVGTFKDGSVHFVIEDGAPKEYRLTPQ